MTITTLDTDNPTLRHRGVLSLDEHALGLRRRLVHTSVGSLVVRTGRRTGRPATILLHGAAGSWMTWTPLIRASDDTAEPMTDIIALDLPGWGDSRASDAVRTVSDMSTAIREVAEELGYQRWHLIGHSLGGFIALDLASRMPAATLSVGLVSATGVSVVDAIRHPLRGGIHVPGFAGMLLAMRMLAPLGDAGTAIVRGLHSLGWLRCLAAPLFAEPDRIHHTVIDALAGEVRPQAFVDAARAAAEYDLDTWRLIRCPVRAVRGERDVFVGDRDRECFAERIARFSEVTMPGAGHFAAVERPEDVLDALVDR